MTRRAPNRPTQQGLGKVEDPRQTAVRERVDPGALERAGPASREESPASSSVSRLGISVPSPSASADPVTATRARALDESPSQSESQRSSPLSSPAPRATPAADPTPRATPASAAIPAPGGAGAHETRASEPRTQVGSRPAVRTDEVGTLKLAARAPASRSVVRARLPRADLASAPIGPREAFVLALLDDVVTVQSLVDMSGLAEPELEAILDRLQRLGLVSFA